MKITYTVLLASIFSFFQSIFGQSTSEELPPLSEIYTFKQGKQAAQQILSELISTRHTPSVSIAVTKHGMTVWEEGLGLANIERRIPPSPTETLYRIASVSKPIAGLGLAKMQENQQIDWNQSLYQYVPDFPVKKYDFTVKQLAGHLSGIRGYKRDEVFNNEPLSIKEGIKLFSKSPLRFKPGSQYYYTSYNWNLVSLAMQNAIGIPFETYMQKEVLNPLGMKHTLPDRGGLIHGQAIPYSGGKGKRDFNRATDVNNFFKLAGGGYLSTAEDVAKLGNAILYHKLLSPEIQEQMLAPQHTDSGKSTGYGIGWQNSKDWKGRHYYGHIGNGIGGYSWFYVYPDKGVVIVMLFNITNPSIGGKVQQAIDYILEGLKYHTLSPIPFLDELEKEREERINSPQ